MRHQTVTLATLLLLLVGGCRERATQPPVKLAEDKAKTDISPQAASEISHRPSEKALKLHMDALVFDSHVDTSMRIADEGYDLGLRHDDGHVDIPRMREGGLDVQMFAVWAHPDEYKGRELARVSQMLDATRGAIEKYPDRIGLVTTAAGAQRLVDQGKIAAFLGVEGGYAIEDKLENLRLLYDKGVRYLTLTWWDSTGWADGSGAEKPKWNGLNELGRQVIREMNRLGMVVDVSHSSNETFYDVLKTTTRPVIASHSCTRAIRDHHRNLDDHQLRALAKNGGVVGINYVAGFLDEAYGKLSSRLWEKLGPRFTEIRQIHRDNPGKARELSQALWDEEAKGFPLVPFERLIEHIDHAVKIAGVDHVGLGSDFDGFGTGPVGLTDVGKLPLITQKLLDRGYSEEDIRKILGGNFMRVFDAVLEDNREDFPRSSAGKVR